MQIRIQQTGVALAPDLVGYIEERIHFTLARYNGNVRSVTIHLEGRQKSECTVEVRTAWGSPIFVQEADLDVYVAVARAVERAGRVVDRHAAAASRWGASVGALLAPRTASVRQSTSKKLHPKKERTKNHEIPHSHSSRVRDGGGYSARQ